MSSEGRSNFNFLEKPIPIIEQVWRKDVKPFVSISCTTYNHEKFIRDSIEGFLIQETTFPVEINIHDDASTDNTANIIREYEEKFPQLLFNSIYQTENQYSKKNGAIRKIQSERAKGKYYAICEGDDYWTDPLKLQKQVNFLEDNSEFVLACGGYKSVNIYTNEEEVIIKEAKNSKKRIDGFEFGLEEMKKQWLSKTLTVVCRPDALKYYPVKKYKYNRDIHLFYHLLKVGKGYYFSSQLGVYRIHKRGINSMRTNKVNFTIAYKIYRELYEKNKDGYTRSRSLVSSINVFKFNIFNQSDYSFLGNLRIFLYAISLLKNVDDFKTMLKSFFPKKVKSKLKN